MSRTILLALGCLLGLGLPLAAQTAPPQSEIGFVAANQREAGQCMRCVGPRFRDSGAQRVPALAPMARIFSARITDLPPYGGWTCRLAALDPDSGRCASEPLTTTDFCLDPASATVTLTIAADGTLSSDQPRLCETDAANIAFLGSRTRSDPPDRDRYALAAAAGNAVIAILEPATRSGTRGRSAILGLRQQGDRSGFEQIVRGTLPLRLETTMPATGNYEIWVAQPGKRSHGAFRGFYRLSLRSNVLMPRLAAGQDTVELAAAGAPPSPLPTDSDCYDVAEVEEILDGALEIRNQSPLTIHVEVSQGSDVLADSSIDRNDTLSCCQQADVDDAELIPHPFRIELEARENGIFVGSTRLLLDAIANRALAITASGNCPR